MFNDCKPAEAVSLEAVSLFVGETYIYHNPHVPDRKESYISYFEQMAMEYPGKHVTIKRIIAEGDLLILHCFQQWPGDSYYAGIDIFRFDDTSTIVEQWDVLQVISDESKNNNGLF